MFILVRSDDFNENNHRFIINHLNEDNDNENDKHSIDNANADYDLE